MKTEQFDKLFDSGKSVSKHIDFSKATRLGVPRQAVIKVWIPERLAEAHA